MPFKYYREESRKAWGVDQEAALDRSQITLGALLRIADAVELMAKNFRDLQEENETLRQSRSYYQAEASRADRKVAALKGVITKLKKHGRP